MTLLESDDWVARILSGRWGDSRELRARAGRWYEGLGLDPAVGSSCRLHPLAEYAANCLYLDREPTIPILEISDLFEPLSRAALIQPKAWDFGREGRDTALRKLISTRKLDDDWMVRKPSSGEVSLLQEGVDLAIQIQPDLAADALSYTRRHAFVRSARMIGRTWTDLGGLTVTGDAGLSSALQLGESLFHEALHAKFYVIERGLAEPTPDETTAPQPVVIPWQQDHDGTELQWTAYRALDAYYVYVHTAAFRLARLKMSGAEGDVDPLRRACFRAAYLSYAIQTVASTHLDSERLGIASWLDSCRVPEFDLNDAGFALLATVQPAGR